MDKYDEAFCKQNPKMALECANPTCKKKHTFKTKDVLKGKPFEFKCVSCGEVTKTQFSIKDAMSQLKKTGVKAK